MAVRVIDSDVLRTCSEQGKSAGLPVAADAAQISNGSSRKAIEIEPDGSIATRIIM